MVKTALITGASRGIGRAAARAFAKEGYRVVINYHQSKEAADELERELSPITDVLAIQADVGDYGAVEQMVSQTLKAFGSIDVLVNNAGISWWGLLTDMTPQQWQEVIQVHLTGTFHCCRLVLPEMLRRHQGVILNVSSIWGMAGASCEVAYSAAKAGVIGLTRALAKEVGPSGIRVNCIAPGVIDTDMNRMFDEKTRQAILDEIPLGRMGTPEEIAQLMVFLASDKAGFITGQVISPNGGML